MKCLLALLAFCWSSALGADLLDDLIFYDVHLQQEIKMGPITPEAVEGFELLYATPGAGDVSEIAGHLLLRVKLNNNPEAQMLGIENPNDLVISLLADTEAGKPPRQPQPVVVQEECQKNNWLNIVADNGDDEPALASIWQSLRGLSGGFSMTMDRQTLGHALKSYTIEQDRNLLRYQLNLTTAQQSNLVAHLYEVQAGTKPKYYFFSQNCGSALVRIIAEGIRDQADADFSPLVSAPHTLIGNLIRHGVATRITPAFYSYRQEGFIARDLFTQRYKELQSEHPEHPWPKLNRLDHSSDSVRAEATLELLDAYHADPQLDTAVYTLASLTQEKEMMYAHKDLVCKKYTSATTAAARTVQQHILESSDTFSLPARRTDVMLNAFFASTEARQASYGTAHTELYSFATGVGFVLQEDQPDRTVWAFDGSLIKQDLGSRSRVAMQRTSAVELGGFSALADHTGITDWRATLLTLRKFRDTLGTVPCALRSTRGLGLGLTVFDMRHDDLTGETVNTIAGFEGLANIAASAHYNDFLLVSLGSELNHNDGYELAMPIGLEHLWSFDHAMNWQWRNRLQYDLISQDRLETESSLAVRLGEWLGADVLLRLRADHRREELDDEHIDTTVVAAQVEVNRW